jgi:uncharacterized membrane protein YgcG
MKKLPYILVLVLALTAMLISACGGSAAISASDSTAVSGGKPQASPVEFTGMIESIVGNQWSINGQTITVDPAVVRNGPFNVGDTVKVEVQVQADGSMVVKSVEAPSTADNSNDINSNDVNSNDVNSNDVNSNDVNSNDINSNDANSNDVNSNDTNINDDNGNDTNTNDDNGNDTNINDDNGNESNSNDNSGNGGNSNSDSGNGGSSNDDSGNGGNSNDD